MTATPAPASPSAFPAASAPPVRPAADQAGRAGRVGQAGLAGWVSHGAAFDLAAEAGRAAALLAEADEVCLACHVRPDGDALGSMLAMAHALAARPGGPPARVVASFGDDPFEVPRILRFLPGTHLLTPPSAYPRRPRVMVTFDASSTDRLGLLQPSAGRAGELVVLDHHQSNTGLGTVHLVDPAAAATAVLAADLISRMGIALTPDIAVCLYAGLVTDTGSFRYSATSPDVHQLAARLLSTGVDPDAVACELWDRAPFRYLGLLGAALERAVIEPDAAAGHGLVWTTVSRADRAARGLPLDVAEPVIDVLRRVDGADVAVVLKQDDGGRWLVSARSRGKVDVGRACTELGGGGHARAAGFTAAGDVGEAMTALRERLADAAGHGG